MMELVIFLMLLACIGIVSFVTVFFEPDSKCAFCAFIVGSLLLISSIGLIHNCSNENCVFHHANAGKNGRTVTEACQQKASDVHQKFLDEVKDDPDFKIYFEK